MRFPKFVALGLVLVPLLAGCGPKYETVTYPPRVDLSEHELIGVVGFAASEDYAELAELATRRFTESARRDQGLVRMVRLEPEDQPPGPDRVRALGREHGLQTVIVGRFDVSDPRPGVSISSSLSSGRLSAAVEAALEVEMIETATGASLWNASAATKTSLGQLSIDGERSIRFDAVDPEAVYGELIDGLVGRVTRDFHSTWGRQPVRSASAAARR
jgi:hypothetical protein